MCTKIACMSNAKSVTPHCSTASEAAHDAGLPEKPATPKEPDKRESSSGPQQGLEKMGGSGARGRLYEAG